MRPISPEKAATAPDKSGEIDSVPDKSGEIDSVPDHGGDIYSVPVALDFSANLNFLGMPEAVRRAAEDGVAASEHYPDPQCRELRAAIARAEQIPVEHILCGNGAAEMIYALVQAVRPRRALLAAPTFSEYGRALMSVECEIRFIPMEEVLLSSDRTGRTDCLFDPSDTKARLAFQYPETMTEVVTADTDLVFLCSPNNPTGLPAERSFLAAMLARCEAVGAVLAVDECFLDFLPDAAAYSVKPYLADHPNLFVLKAFTKLYAMPGLRLGYGLCSDTALLGRMEAVRPPWSVSIPAQRAGIAALKEAEYLRRTHALLPPAREELMRGLAALGFVVYDSRANFILFQGSPGLADRCLAEGIRIRDCANFRGLGPGYYRVAVRRPEENRRLLEQLAGM